MSDTHERERRRYETALVWLRRDLRLHDHPALVAALAAAEHVVPLFVSDDALLGGRWPAPNRLWFMRECVRLLGDDLRARGGGLALRRGCPPRSAPRRSSSRATTAPTPAGATTRSPMRWRGTASASTPSAG